MGANEVFACVQMIPPEATPLLKRRKPPQPCLVRVNLPGGVPFFRLEVPQRKGAELPFGAMECAAGRLRTRLLLPKGMALPAPPKACSPAQAQLEPGLRAFAPKRLPLLLCLRAAQQALCAANTPPQQLRVTVVDAKGVLCHNIETLVPLAGSLRVLTSEFPPYRKAAAQLLHRYGATLILSDSPGCFAQSHVIVADDLRRFTGCERGLIFTPDAGAPPRGCRVVRCQAPQLPPAYAALCPPDIDPLLFASALYELCGVKELERLPFGRFAFDGASRALRVEDLARIVDQEWCMRRA
jgi:hypothetical protein